MNGKLRTEEEVQEAIRSYNEDTYEDFKLGYQTETVRESVGFLKACKWFLFLNEESSPP